MSLRGRQPGPWAALASTLMLLPTVLGSAGEEDRGLRLLCLDLHTVLVTWDHGGHDNLSLHYRFDEEAAWGPCGAYAVGAGLRSGCALGVRGDILHLTLRDGGRALLNLSRYVADFLKPATLRDLRFLWSPDGSQVTVRCPDLRYRGLSYQVQHRAARDPAWQTHEETTCVVTVAGLDPGLCLSFRARAAPRPAVYGPEAQPGDWTRETHWTGGRPAEHCEPSPASVPALAWRCPAAWPPACCCCCAPPASTLGLHPGPPPGPPPNPSLHPGPPPWASTHPRPPPWASTPQHLSSRVKQRLLPWVPDPRGSFPGLFETHHGHFQEWILHTQAVTPPRATEPTEAHEVLEVRPGPENSYTHSCGPIAHAHLSPAP
ncbi:cytokine receptor-like factor 2 [Dipodomys spectabilis]|uniref:cytokine receptor-like factor 2 n=1 Tax=Dipodomys spectabilis TaxID=105255 RepID=UPI001C53EDEC|nr:cytokine receptor-like factor 2 [Dipodomys spectabilis]